MNKKKFIILLVTLLIPYQTIFASNDDIPAFWRGVICFAVLFGAKAIFSIISSAIDDRKKEEKKKEQARELSNKQKLDRKRKEREYMHQLEMREKQKAEEDARIASEKEEKERLIREEIKKNRIVFEYEKYYDWDWKLTKREMALLCLEELLMERLKQKWGNEFYDYDMKDFLEKNLHFLGFENTQKFSTNMLTASYQGRLCYIKMFPFKYDDLDSIQRDYNEFLQFIRKQKAEGIYVVRTRRHGTLKTLCQNDYDIHFIDCQDIHMILKSIGEGCNLQDENDNAEVPMDAEQIPLYLYERYGYCSWRIVRWNFYLINAKFSPIELYHYLSQKPRVNGSYALLRHPNDDSYMLYTPSKGRFNCILESLSFVIEGKTLRNSFVEHKLFKHWYHNWSESCPIYNRLGINE